MDSHVIIDLEKDLTGDERRHFEANAHAAGRTAAQHVRALLFGPDAAHSTDPPLCAGPRRPHRKAKPSKE